MTVEQNAQAVGAAVAALPDDAVKTAAVEVKNALDLVKDTFDTFEGDADQLIDVASVHVEAAYEAFLKLVHLQAQA